MNNLDIDDILSAVNNINDDDGIQNMLGGIRHRSCEIVQNQVHSPNLYLKATVNRPEDPVGSVSSSDIGAHLNGSIVLGSDGSQKPADVKHMLQNINIVDGQIGRQNKIQKIPIMTNISTQIAENSKQNNKKNIITTDVNKRESDCKDVMVISSSSQCDGLKTHMTSLLGYNIPTSTLYFIIVMTIITTTFYFLTAKKKLDKNKDKIDKNTEKR